MYFIQKVLRLRLTSGNTTDWLTDILTIPCSGDAMIVGLFKIKQKWPVTEHVYAGI